MLSSNKTNRALFKLSLTIIFIFLFFGSFCAWAQYTVTGKVTEKATGKPIPNATVFLNQSTIGTKTDKEGAFSLINLASGSYKIVITCVGFETNYQDVNLSNGSQNLGVIILNGKAIKLMEVKIKNTKSSAWFQNYEMFKREFLGTSSLSKDCKILNPEVLNLHYQVNSDLLTANTDDFLIIENRDLGYRLRYFIESFYRAENGKKVNFNGSVLFENMEGTEDQTKYWLKKRKAAYEGSSMHFFRSAIANQLEEEGFRVFQYAIYANPDRLPDSLIKARIDYFSEKVNAKNNRLNDSLRFYKKMLDAPKEFRRLLNYPLNGSEFIKRTNQKTIFALSCDKDGLYVMYSKRHHFASRGDIDYLNNPYNLTHTLLTFTVPNALFDNKGWLIVPESLIITGVWVLNRVAGLLPTDYDPNQ